jgi:hypothetical protein
VEEREGEEGEKEEVMGVSILPQRGGGAEVAELFQN